MSRSLPGLLFLQTGIVPVDAIINSYCSNKYSLLYCPMVGVMAGCWAHCLLTLSVSIISVYTVLIMFYTCYFRQE